MFSTNGSHNCCGAPEAIAEAIAILPGNTFFVEKITKNRLRGRLIARIGGASVRKINLLFTIVCGCALAVSANAARTESLSFKPQTVFQKRTDKAVSEPS